MNDFNFFEPYIKVPVKRNYSQWFIAVAAIVLVMALGGIQVLYMNKIRQKEAVLEGLKAYNQSPEVVRSLDLIDQMQARVQALETLYTEVNVTTAQIESENRVTDLLMEEVNAQVPEGVFLDRFDFTGGGVVIEGYAVSYEGVAQLAYNLRTTGRYGDVRLPKVADQNGQLQYVIDLLWQEEVVNAD
ncbi:PilN domain-containing protein [Fusibacter sp. JL298sf-3]